MSAINEQFTERQARGWAEAITDIHSRGVEPSDNPDGFYWTLVFAEEIRPGRGQDLTAFWNDGERLVHVRIDVYGSWTVAIAELDWLHASSDEDCGCDRCVADRSEDEELAAAERELVDVAVVGGVL